MKHKHGIANSLLPEYRVWNKMKDRCYNKDSMNYRNYGGRGISICEKWLTSFENFINDMGLRPSSKHSIERINNDGNYEPQNCKWATKKEQSYNRRDNVNLNYNGRTQCLTKWAKEFGLSIETLRRRLNSGTPIETALTAPLYSHGKSAPKNYYKSRRGFFVVKNNKYYGLFKTELEAAEFVKNNLRNSQPQ